MDGVTLQILGGIGTIGGTKVLVRDGGDAVLLDCGLAYMPGADLFEGPVRPRGLPDLLATGLAPDIPGLYAETGPRPPAVFITHAHLDHMALLPHLADRVAVHCAPETAAMLQALRAADPASDRARTYRAAAPGQTVDCGRIAVTAHAVDHDVPGACAYSVRTRAGTIVYSGDLRLHGLHPERTAGFVRAAAALRPAVLLMEGTRLAPPAEPGDPTPEADLDEADVAVRAERAMAAASGLAVVNAYPRDVERCGNLCRAALRAGRRLALDPAAAALLRACGGGIPSGGAVLGEDTTLAEVAGAPGRWAIQLALADLPALIDLRPPSGSVYLQAGGEPFGARHPWWPLLLRWLRLWDLELAPVGCSGHARPADLLRIGSEIAPAVLLPVHSRFPELLAPPGVRVLLPEAGRRYDVERLAAG
jgi:ribonuclease J